jgi:gliding motility-associated protein GldM
MEATNKNFESKVADAYTIFSKALVENKDKVQANYNKAQQAKKLTEEFRRYVQDARTTLIVKATGLSQEEARTLRAEEINRQDDYDTPTRYFIEQGKGKELREKIDAYEKAMLALLPENSRSHIKSPFNIKGPFRDADKKEVNWETATFYQSIIVAAITILNKLENDAMNLEYDVVNELFNLVSASDMKFSDAIAKIVPKSTFVALGEPFEAEIFLAAFDSKTKVSANVNGQNFNSKDGVITYAYPTTKEGIFPITGYINVPGAKKYPFRTEYIVARPAASISLDAMNVFYIGVDNPISCAVSGIDPSGVTPSISGNGNSIHKVSGSNYTVRVANPGKTTITLSVKSGNSTKVAGTFTYRVKRVPDPIVLVNGIDEHMTSVDKNVLANSGGLVAKMKEFEFDLGNLKIISFSMSTTVNGDNQEDKSTNNRFTDKMITLMKNARKGQKFYFENVVCQMPTGPTTLRPITLTVR